MEIILIILVHAIVVGFFTSWLANNKGFEREVWFILGFFFAEIALLTLVGAQPLPMIDSHSPRQRPIENPKEDPSTYWICPKCEKSNPGHSFTCEHCGFRLK